MSMSDEELAKYLGIDDDARWPKVIAGLMPISRAVYDRMAEVEMEIKLYEAGIGLKPKDVILTYPNKRR